MSRETAPRCCGAVSRLMYSISEFVCGASPAATNCRRYTAKCINAKMYMVLLRLGNNQIPGARQFGRVRLFVLSNPALCADVIVVALSA